MKDKNNLPVMTLWFDGVGIQHTWLLTICKIIRIVSQLAAPQEYLMTRLKTQDSVLCRSLYLAPNLYIQTVSLFQFLCKLYRLAAFSSVVVGRQLQILHCAKTQMQSSEHSGAHLLSGHFNWCHVIWSVVWEWMLLNHGDVQVKECTGWFFFFPLMFLYM